MIDRIEVVVYFTNEDAANEFVREHVVAFSNEPWPNPTIVGFAIRELRYPSNPADALEIRVKRYGTALTRDEDAREEHDRISQVLSIPVTDFALPIRSRDCLQKMGIMTLGDLCACTEQELLSSENFGETSLAEIREMLVSKGLSFRQHVQEQPAVNVQVLSDKPIAELKLSIRARKCMIRLGISTIADLVRLSGDDLLECRNFGITSLNNIREKLQMMGLKLRGE